MGITEKVGTLGTPKRNSILHILEDQACCIHIHDKYICLTLTLLLFLEVLCTGVPQDGAGDIGAEEPPLVPYRNKN